MTSQGGENNDRILVTGATGYVGAQLVPHLVERGARVRVLVRDREKFMHGPCEAVAGRVEVVEGDATERGALATAMSGIGVAYYLLHSMGSGEGEEFLREEEAMARLFAEAAEHHHVRRIVYLGGLHPEGEQLSEHLESRKRVGRVFLESSVPAAVLQAGVIIGNGSASYAMLSSYAARSRVFAVPGWMHNRITPIAIRDAVYYLAGAASLHPELNRTFDIGGPDTLEYVEMLRIYREVAGKKRALEIPAPKVPPALASVAISALTPVKRSLAAPIVESILHDTVVKERDLQVLAGKPRGGLTPFRDAVAQAQREERSGGK